MLTPKDLEVANAFINGRSRAQIAADQGVTPASIGHRLNKPAVAEEIKRRLAALAERTISFKLRAFDGAEGALDKLIAINEASTTPLEMQRYTSLDLIKISGLMPRKRILVEANTTHGIDDDAKDFISQVLKEAEGIVDAKP